MKDIDKAGICAWCDRPSHIRQGRIMLCAMHYRIASMQAAAKRAGKVAPGRHAIEALVPNPFKCEGCQRGMVWLRQDGTSNQATLQHDRGGALRIICLACNTRHASHPGDTFYAIPEGHKRCPDCSAVMPLQAFCVDASRPVGRKSYCRPCSSRRFKEWGSRNVAA